MYTCDDEINQTKGNFYVRNTSYKELWRFHCDDKCEHCFGEYTPGPGDPSPPDTVLFTRYVDGWRWVFQNVIH